MFLAAQQCAANSGEQFAWLERLDDIIVGSQLHPADIQESEIDDAQVGWLGSYPVHQIGAGAKPLGTVAKVDEHLDDESCDVGFVFNQEDRRQRAAWRQGLATGARTHAVLARRTVASCDTSKGLLSIESSGSSISSSELP